MAAPRSSNRDSALLLAASGVLLAGVAAASRASSFGTPLSEDTGAYLYIGQGVLEGDTPYADGADNKGPATYLLFALIRLVAGQSTTGVRMALLAAAAITAVAVAGYVMRWAGRIPGLAAGALFAVLGSTPYLEGNDPNTEQFGVAPMALGLWAATRRDARGAVAAGALTALAALLNPGFVVVALIVAAQIWRSSPATLQARTRRLGLATIGGVAVAGVFAAWLALGGALGDFWVQVVDKAGTAVGGQTAGVGGFGSRGFLEVPARGLIAAGAVGAVIALSDRRLRWPAGVALAWIALMCVRVKLASYEFDHHYYPAVVGVCLGLALGGATLEQRLRRGALRPLVVGALAALSLALAWLYVGRPERAALAKPAEQRVRFPQYATAYVVGREVARITPPGSTLFVSGNNPTVYWVADRRAPTRFFAEYALATPAYVAERLRSLRASPPYAVAFVTSGSLFEGQVRSLVRRDGYRRIWRRADAEIWVRRPTS